MCTCAADSQPFDPDLAGMDDMGRADMMDGAAGE